MKIIKKVRKRVDKFINKLIFRAKRLFGKKGGKGKNGKEVKEDVKGLTAKDKKKHKQYVDEIGKTLKKPGKKNPESFEEFYKEKQKLAKELEKRYNKKLTKKVNGKPIKTTITMGSLAVEKKDGDLDLKIRIAPNDASGEVHLSIVGEDEKGAIDLYRGLHFKRNWPTKDYMELLAQKVANTTTFSEAVIKESGSNEPHGNDIPESEKLAKAIEVIERIEKTKNPKETPQWWGNKKKTFDSEYLALVQRFVNTYDEMKNELESDRYQGSKFFSIPFISISKDPSIAEKFARGHMVKSNEEAFRTQGKVGRIFVYVFSIPELKKMNAIDIVALNKTDKVNIKHRYLAQKEVAFSGAIPSKFLVSGVDVVGSQKTGKSASEARDVAKFVADKKGGLRKWKAL